MHIEYWSFAAGYCKIKTARQKKRLQKEDFDKQLIHLDQLEDALYERKRTLPLIPLTEPYQRGWKRMFILREDVARSKQADFYQHLLKKINTVEYANNKQFAKKKWRKRRKVYEVRIQQLREFYIHEWNHPECKLTAAEKVHFHIKEYWDWNRKEVVKKFVFNEPWRYVLQIKPNMITHVRMVDEALESELQQLQNHIVRNHFSPVMDRLIRGRCYRPWRSLPNERERNPLKNKPLYKILEAVANDDL